MYNRGDPRLRRTINQITSNLESANESAQSGLVSVTEHYIRPCLSSTGAWLQENCATTCAPCFPSLFPTDDRRRPRRQALRGRAGPERSFDFYDDWEEDENAALLSWGNEEYERLQGDDRGAQQPGKRRQIGMNYGTQGSQSEWESRRQRRFTAGSDPPDSSSQKYIGGLLDKLPFALGGARSLKYQPSAEGLQERARDQKRDSIDDEQPQTRKRSGTIDSGHTSDSHSSRGDIFPSDDEDAVPIDDELGGMLEETSTNSASKGSGRRSKRPSLGKASSRSDSSRSLYLQEPPRGRTTRRASHAPPADSEQLPTLSDLRHEEQTVEVEEESNIERERLAAQRLAAERGLTNDAAKSAVSNTQDVASIDHVETTSPSASQPQHEPALGPEPEESNG